jgi:hypothetical protein
MGAAVAIRKFPLGATSRLPLADGNKINAIRIRPRNREIYCREKGEPPLKARGNDGPGDLR